ncbi:MAG: hypothetical protein ABIT71_26230 [Vicinamibacteraceae bacterium]
MRRLLAGAFVGLMVIGVRAGGSQSRPEMPPPEGIPSVSCMQAMALQNRMNRYFHRAVVPRMVSCWRGIRDAGTVSISFDYQRSGDQFVPRASKIRESTLAAPVETERALACLQSAIVGTGFAVEAEDKDIPAFALHWSFPVPMPEDLDAAAARIVMLDNGSGPRAGQCGGSEGPKPACSDCFFVPFASWSWCSWSCAGYSGCKGADSGCDLYPPKCVTGSLFGNIGGLVAY